MRSRLTCEEEESFKINVPSEFLKLQAMVMDKDDDFAREYTVKKGMAPSIILYKNEQIDDLAHHAKNSTKFIVGIERTFTLETSESQHFHTRTAVLLGKSQDSIQ